MSSRTEHIKHVIAVGSGKGGVGKSTVAVNLALSLKTKGHKVGLLDADIYGPSIPVMLGVQGVQPDAHEDGTLEPVKAHGLSTMSVGFIAKDTQAIIWRGPMIHKILAEFFSRVNWGELDYLIVDLPPGTGDVQLSLSQLIPLTGAVVVTTPQEVALADVRRAVEMFRKVNISLLGVIENMSYYICKKCNDREEIFSHGGGQDAAKRWETDFLGEIPLVPDVRKAGDMGVPIVAYDPKASISESFQEVSQRLTTLVTASSQQDDALKIVRS